MEPAVAIDTKGLAGILLELGGAVDGLEEREKALDTHGGEIGRGGLRTVAEDVEIVSVM